MRGSADDDSIRRLARVALAAIACALAAMAAGCGSSAPGRSVRRAAASHAAGRAPRARAGPRGRLAGTEVRRSGPGPTTADPHRIWWRWSPTRPGTVCLLVSVPGIRLLRTVAVPGEPEYVAGTSAAGPVAVVSAGSASVRLLGGPRLLGAPVPGRFVSPHVTALAPGGDFVYVTDDGSGRADVIGLARPRIVSRGFVGLGAHHLAFSPTGRQVWVVLGQSAHTVAILSTASRPPLGRHRGQLGQPGTPPASSRIWTPATGPTTSSSRPTAAASGSPAPADRRSGCSTPARTGCACASRRAPRRSMSSSADRSPT